MAHRTSNLAFLTALIVAASCRPATDSRKVESEPVRAVSGPAEPHAWAALDVATSNHDPLTPALSPVGGAGGNSTATATATAISTRAPTATPISAPTATGDERPTAARRPITPPDTNPPTTPSPLTVEASSEHSVNLHWGASRDDVGVTAYEVRRGEVRVATGSGTGTYAVERNLRPAATYCYTVRAFDKAGNASPQAGPVCATTPDLTPPTVPPGVAAAALGETDIELRWHPSTDEVAVVGYEVLREGHVVAGAPGTTAREHGLKAAVRYCYQVRAYDAAENRSALSTEACAETPDLTPPTTPLHVVARATSDRSIDLGWQASADNVGVTHYQVLRDGEVLAEPRSARFEEQDLRPGVSYCYTVRALDAAGNTSPPSANACAVTPDVSPPTIPEAIAAQPVSPSSIYLAWHASEDDVGVAGYEVLGDDKVLMRVLGTDAYTAALAADTRHCFRVRAFDRAGNRSRPSRPACSTTASAELPSAPYRLRAEPASDKAVSLTWEPSSQPGVVYRVYWENDKNIGATRLTAFGAVGLKPGERHCYRVAAVDETGQESSRTLEACAAPKTQSLSSR